MYVVCHLTLPKTSWIKRSWLGIVTKLSRTGELLTVTNDIVIQILLLFCENIS